jgi:large subunit ribosomal protein L18
MSFNRKDQRTIRHRRLRQRVQGTAERPRMAIFLSNQHMYVQFIDDCAGRTLAQTSTVKTGKGRTLVDAQQVGAQAAEAALAKGLRLVVVDRGGFQFHGRVKQLVEAAVAAGLKITNDDVSAAEVTK